MHKTPKGFFKVMTAVIILISQTSNLGQADNNHVYIGCNKRVKNAKIKPLCTKYRCNSETTPGHRPHGMAWHGLAKAMMLRLCAFDGYRACR